MRHGSVVRVAVIAVVWATVSNCAARQARATADFGIPVCTDGAGRDLLSSDALQCWFTASHGQWRTLNHQSHLEALVVDIEARDLRDAVEIAQHVVADPMAAAYSEILVYVARPEGPEVRIRRVRWIRGGPTLETLDFTSPAGDAPLTVRSSPGGKPMQSP